MRFKGLESGSVSGRYHRYHNICLHYRVSSRISNALNYIKSFDEWKYICTYIHIYKHGKNSTFFVLEFLEKILKYQINFNLSDWDCKYGMIHIIAFPTQQNCIIYWLLVFLSSCFVILYTTRNASQNEDIALTSLKHLYRWRRSRSTR